MNIIIKNKHKKGSLFLPQAPEKSILYTKLCHFHGFLWKSSKINIKREVYSCRRRLKNPLYTKLCHFHGFSPTCKSKAACKFSENHQKQAPTATGLSPSNAVQKLLPKSWFKVTKGTRKVCFMVDLLLRKNFGPNVDVNFLANSTLRMNE